MINKIHSHKKYKFQIIAPVCQIIVSFPRYAKYKIA